MSSAPNLNNPSNYLSYQYNFQDIREPLDFEIEKIKEEINGKINPEIENGKKWSPARKKRVIAITCIAVAVILAVGAVLASCLVGAPLFSLLGLIPLAAGGIAAGCLWPKHDYDSQKYRQKVMKKIENYSFKEIIEHHNTDDVIGYGLLDKIVPKNITNEKVRAAFYQKYKQLVDEYNSIDRQYNNDKNKIQNIWEGETQPLRSWKNDKETIIRQNQVIRHQANHIVSENIRRRGHETGARVVRAVGNVGNTVGDILDQDKLARINQIYGEKIAPWNRWKGKELANIETVYKRTILGIGTLYNDEKGKLLSSTR